MLLVHGTGTLACHHRAPAPRRGWDDAEDDTCCHLHKEPPDLHCTQSCCPSWSPKDTWTSLPPPLGCTSLSLALITRKKGMERVSSVHSSTTTGKKGDPNPPRAICPAPTPIQALVLPADASAQATARRQSLNILPSPGTGCPAMQNSTGIQRIILP